MRGVVDRSPPDRLANRSGARRSGRTNRETSPRVPGCRCRARRRCRCAGRSGRTAVAPRRAGSRRARPACEARDDLGLAGCLVREDRRLVVARAPHRADSTIGRRTPDYHAGMYLDAMEFLEEERDAWAPYEALAEPRRRAARTPGRRRPRLVRPRPDGATCSRGRASPLEVAKRARGQRDEPDDRPRGRRLGGARRRRRQRGARRDVGGPADGRAARAFRTQPGELRGYLTVVPETRWLKHADHLERSTTRRSTTTRSTGRTSPRSSPRPASGDAAGGPRRRGRGSSTGIDPRRRADGVVDVVASAAGRSPSSTAGGATAVPARPDRRRGRGADAGHAPLDARPGLGRHSARSCSTATRPTVRGRGSRSARHRPADARRRASARPGHHDDPGR